jgi:hypothetical protein
VAAAGGARRPPTLADHYRTTPGRHLQVTAEGRVSLSAAGAEQGRFYGDLAAGAAAWRASPLWREATSFADRVFAGAHACAFCPHWAACRGCFRLPDPARDACAGWRAAFDEVRQSGRAVRAAAAARGRG